MKITCRKKIAINSRKDAIVIPVYKNISSLRNITGKKLDDELKAILDSDYFNFDEKEIKSFYVDLNKKLKKIYLVSIPKESEYSSFYREIGAKVAAVLKDDKIYSCSLIAFEDIYGEKKDYSATTAFVEGMMFCLYSFDKYKTKKEPYELEELEVITNMIRLKTYIDTTAAEWNDTFYYVNMARDLVNSPANDLTPESFAAYARENACESLKVEVWDERKILEEELNLVHAVGRASSNPPRFVRLSYQGAPDSDQNIAFVGKGVTFDTGGTNLKPATAMDGMKHDMAGAAVVFAAANLIACRGLKVNLHVYIPLVENVIGTSAMRPGDIVKSYSGKTVEILNTDAEGRLILADALFMATKTDPEIIIDIATLTGACVVALGEYCAGLFSNRKFLSKHVSDVASRTGEDVWELPLFEPYAARLKSKNADMGNMASTGRNAGSIIAALFLKEFVENYPWVHLDIAGTAFLDVKHPVFGSQATGFGVRLLYHFIKQYYVI